MAHSKSKNTSRNFTRMQTNRIVKVVSDYVEKVCIVSQPTLMSG